MVRFRTARLRPILPSVGAIPVVRSVCLSVVRRNDVTREKTERASTESVQELWEQYHETADKRIRDRLVLSLAPMVKYIVYVKVREIPARCEVEDFICCGLEAVMRSIDRYDPERGVTLEQFAWTRILGAVLDELRRNDGAPRSLRRFERDISAAREKFIALHGRQPTRTELSAAVNMSEADPEKATVREHGKERFREAFEQLPERERQVAVLLYVNNLTLREIGETLGVPESSVRQIHSQLRRRLREMLSTHNVLFSEVA
jgi:RNA polymerase sigma factor for flagellar operon FliA